MGVSGLSSILKTPPSVVKEKSINKFSGRIIAFDGYNVLYQFLATIRDNHGFSLTDREGRTTSHLIGLLSRNSQLLSLGIKPIFVLDGKPHKLKKETIEHRSELKQKAEKDYRAALKHGDLAKAKSLSQRISRLDKNMIDDAKTLLKLMGIPVVEGLGEGEAQAAQLVIEQTAHGVGSQDYDALLFGTPTLIRNLNLSGKRNLPGGNVKTIYPEELHLAEVCKTLNLEREQLIDMGILLGTDFNPEGFPGVGPKTALKFMQKHGNFYTAQQKEAKITNLETYEQIKQIFLMPEVQHNVQIKFGLYDVEGILDFLVSERGFTADRYMNLLKSTEEKIENLARQTNLLDFFS